MSAASATACHRAAQALGPQVRSKSFEVKNLMTANRIRNKYLQISYKNMGSWDPVLERYTPRVSEDDMLNQRSDRPVMSELLFSSSLKKGGTFGVADVDGVPSKFERLSKWLYQNYSEPFNFARSYLSLYGDCPYLPWSTVISPAAMLQGRITMGNCVSIFDRAILRGTYKGTVHLGDGCVVMEGAIVEGGSKRRLRGPMLESGTILGKHVIVGGGATIIGAEIYPNVLIGDNTVVEEGAHIGANSIIGANSVVEAGQFIGDMEVWAGKPARFIRRVGPTEAERVADLSTQAFTYSRNRIEADQEFGEAYLDIDAQIQDYAKELAKLATPQYIHSARDDLGEALTPYDEREVPTATWTDRVNAVLQGESSDRGVTDYKDWAGYMQAVAKRQ